VVAKVKALQAKVDQVLDKGVEWVVAQARRLGKFVAGAARSAAGRLIEWWKKRKSFAASDRSSHALYFVGQAASADLTVASAPMPVTAFLRAVRPKATSSSDPNVVSSFQAADKLTNEILRLKATVEGGPNPRQPADIDSLNGKLDQLAGFLGPLIPLLYPSTAPAGAGTVPVKEGQLIKVRSRNLIAVVSEIDSKMVRYKFIRPGQRMVSAEGLTIASFNRDFGSEFVLYVEDPRELYMGPTPKKDKGVGAQVKARMASEQKLRVNSGVEEILYSRDGKWWKVANCDMGHIIDAVVWWNSNGRLTGAQSADVIRFMNDPGNYELEPSGPNRSRGARLGIKYLPPAV
jgi:hypothetical protein